MKRIDLTGATFDRLVVLSIGSTGAEGPRWLCRCACGTEKDISGKHLRRGAVVSCGCLRKETSRANGLARRTHGHAVEKTPEYRAWRHAIDRCHNAAHKQFKDYGGRGITVCAEWRSDFASFLAHIGPRPSSAHSIDREKNHLGYQPGNVRWATRKEQNRNRRSNHVVEVRGSRMTLAEAIEGTSTLGTTVRNRISRGWAVEDALL